jgi:hypothetical protein
MKKNIINKTLITLAATAIMALPVTAMADDASGATADTAKSQNGCNVKNGCNAKHSCNAKNGCNAKHSCHHKKHKNHCHHKKADENTSDNQ